MKVSISDVSKRMNYNPSIKNTNAKKLNHIKLYSESGKFNESNAFHLLNNWMYLGENTNEAYNNVLDVYIEICENCNDSKIKDAERIMIENIIKVRDSKQMLNSLKYRMSRLKSKSRININKALNQNKNINDTLNNISSKLSIQSPTVASPSSDSQQNQQSTEENYLSNIYNQCKMLYECDRIVENYNKILKRFDIDKMVDDYCDDIYQCVNEICKCVDTYNIPFINKYNTALESIYLAFDKKYIRYPKDKIIESVTDYFIFNTKMDDNNFKDIEFICNECVLFDKDDFKPIEYLYKENHITENTIDPEYETASYGVEYFNENNLKDVTKGIYKTVKNDSKSWIHGRPEERDSKEDEEVKEMIQDFRKQCAKADKNEENNMLISYFKSLITKLFSRSPECIINELPSIFTLVRVTFIIGVTSISAPLGLITLITNFVVKMVINRKQCEKIIKAYEKEIESAESKISSSKDKYTKERLEKYKNKLSDDLKKIKKYRDTLYTDEENFERDDYSFDDDFDFNFDDFSFDESQMTRMSSIIIISELMQSINEHVVDTDIDGIISKNIYKFSTNTIDNVTDFSVTVPVILEKQKLCTTLENYRNELRKSDNLNDMIRIEYLNNDIQKLQESNTIYNSSNDMKTVISTLLWLDEMTKYNSIGYVNEMNFTNTLKLALNRLKNSATKLSDKEKQISKTIDASVNNLSNAIEKAMLNDSRDAIIKGRILPSASKCIKIALATGAAWAVQPAIAVIGVLGAFACHKNLSAKERQLALDDIEIELKMADRYLKRAEDANDMNAIRQCEIIKRNLERQQQRIKYKMHVVYNQKVPNVPSDNND